jgi:hypothetical protein
MFSKIFVLLYLTFWMSTCDGIRMNYDYSTPMPTCLENPLFCDEEKV